MVSFSFGVNLPVVRLQYVGFLQSYFSVPCGLSWCPARWMVLCLLFDEGSVKYSVHVPGFGLLEQEDTNHPWWNK